MSEIHLMPAGLEIDRMVAERIFGLVVTEDENNFRGVSIGESGYHGCDLPFYSSSIAVAMTVADQFEGFDITKMDGTMPRYTVAVIYGDQSKAAWSAEFCTLPLAICRAALKAKAKETS